MNENSNQSGFYLLSDNADAFTARFALATRAKKTLDIQYYIMHNDASGQYLAYAMLSAADRGVHVRILVDDINLSGRDNNLKMLSQHENIEIRIFNPLSNRGWFRAFELLVNLDRAGRRMHNKTFICDNLSAIIGGRNIGDEYFDSRHKLNFVDLDLLTTGPIVQEISQSFNDYWNSHCSTAIEDISKISVVKSQLTAIRRKLKDRWHHVKNTEYFNSLKQSNLTKKIIDRSIPFIWADATLFYDQPEKTSKQNTENHVHFGTDVRHYFEQVKHELLIATPYFVPGQPGTQWLKDKKQSGIKIQILTNSLAATDVIAVHAGYQKYRKQLLKAGIQLFELKTTANRLRDKTKKLLKGFSNSSLHAKYLIIDHQYVLIGSANIDPRSKNLNTEIGILVNSKELAQQASELFKKSTSPDNSYKIKINKAGDDMFWVTEDDEMEKYYFSEPNSSYLRRAIVFVLSLLPIESLL